MTRPSERTRALIWSRHHALADAQALMAGYRAWHQFMEKIWSIES